MFLAFIAAISTAAENMLDKTILKKREVSFQSYLALTISMIFLLALIPFYFLGGIDSRVFQTGYILTFIGIIVVAFLYNILFFYALSKEQLCDVEPFVLLDTPATVILAALIFPSERNIFPLMFALIAAGALIASKFEKRHLKFKKSTFALFGFAILIAIEALLVKHLLTVMAPVSIYTLRVGFLALLSWVLLRPSIKKIKKSDYFEMSGSAALSLSQYIFKFYAIMYVGIVQTSLILLLSPVMVLIYSKFFLKEKLTLKKVAADAIIIMCVAGAFLFK